MQIQKANILGIGVSAINMPMALEVIDGWIKRGERNFVTVTGVHGVMESQKDSDLLRIHNVAGLVTPDGMPLTWISRLLGFTHVDRVYGPDLLLAVCDRSPAQGYRHFFYGGGDGVADLLKDRLQARFPGLDVVGTYTPPFRPLTEEEDEDIVRYINALNPDIVWIGLSTPKQERWMAAHLGRIAAPVMIGVGAAFDFQAGLKKQAPPWIQRSGLEWLYRLCSEPKRLWKRYLTNNPAFVWRVVGQLSGLKRYEPD